MPPGEAKELDDERFFTEGIRRSSMPPAIESDEDERTIRLREDPEVLARRAKSVRIVTRVMAGVAALFLVGLFVKLREAPPAAPPPPVFAHTEGSNDLVPAPAPLPSSTATAAEASKDAAPETDAATSGNDASTPDASVVDAAVPDASPAAAAATDGDASVDAKALKKACQRALDSGKLAEAIEKGEASVAADPTDGEAWLLLGASYEQKGRGADAKRAYKSCVTQGKRGPIGECAALAH